MIIYNKNTNFLRWNVRIPSPTTVRYQLTIENYDTPCIRLTYSCYNVAFPIQTRAIYTSHATSSDNRVSSRQGESFRWIIASLDETVLRKLHLLEHAKLTMSRGKNRRFGKRKVPAVSGARDLVCSLVSSSSHRRRWDKQTIITTDAILHAHLYDEHFRLDQRFPRAD